MLFRSFDIENKRLSDTRKNGRKWTLFRENCNFAENINHMKRILLTTIFLLALAVQGHAVLKEKDLPHTLSILREELTNYYRELEQQSELMKQQREAVGKNIFTVLSKSNQNALMLYSQKPDYIFDLTYACHEATEQYHEFKRTVLPFNTFVARTESEIARYDSLVTALSQMHVAGLDERGKIDRNVCLTLAVSIRRTLQTNSEQLQEYIHYYEVTEQRLRHLNDYANKRYYEIQTSIFSNNGENYLQTLTNLGHNLRHTEEAITEKYRPLLRVHSQWDSRMILGLFLFLAFYALVAIVLNMVLSRVLLPRMLRMGRLKTLQESFVARRTYIFMATTVVTFAIILGIVRVSIEQNFFIMASDLLVNYAWLMGVIIISLLLRLDSEHLRPAFHIYVPLLVVGFIVFTFRIILIPNVLVNLVFPPILLACMLWQWKVIQQHKNRVPRADVTYTTISLIVFIASVISSWVGYTLLSVQLLIWWIMQLTCILTITCLAGYMQRYAQRHNFDEKAISRTWLFNFIYSVIRPVLGIFSVLFSVYWAADVFNLSDTIRTAFSAKFVDTPYIQLSIFALCQVLTLYFIFAYIDRTLKRLAQNHFEESDATTAATRNVMARNVIQLLVWGVWLLISLGILHINNTWFVVISGGLSTGIGFAMKDILENIYYGISLMAGRIKVGDLIECDGIRGYVSSINYTSTMLDTIDGSVIAFQNSQLFTKNYRNLTKNHGYELAILPVGVAYGSDPQQVKQLILDAVKPLKCYDKKRPVKVIFAEMADSSVNFKVVIWVPVATKIYATGDILEAIYNTLNEHNIEIPFPQRDVHIVNN